MGGDRGLSKFFFASILLKGTISLQGISWEVVLFKAFVMLENSFSITK
jgi:hypothetical protein